MMGFHKVPYLYCNGNSPDCECSGGEATSGDSGYDTIEQYRKWAIKTGWFFKAGNKAFCPECRKESKQ